MNSMSSIVSKAAFNQACVAFGVILTNEEVFRLQMPDGKIDFCKVSKALDLHNNNLDLISMQTLRKNIARKDLESIIENNLQNTSFQKNVPVKIRRLNKK